METQVKKLKINYKTLQEFKSFKEYGLQELSMVKDLEANIVDNDVDSPFYGIYFEDQLVARMSLYKVGAKDNNYFHPPQDYLELWKLEVLPDYQRRGYGRSLVEYAKSFNMPIKTNPRCKSHEFWTKMEFSPIEYDMNRDLGQNPLIWDPSKA